MSKQCASRHWNLLAMFLVLGMLLPLTSLHTTFAAATCNTSGSSYTVTVCINLPENGSSVSDIVPVSATTTISGSSATVRRVEFYLDGEYVLTDYEAPYTFQLDTKRWIDANRTLSARALLSDGFTSQYTAVSLIFANGLSSIPPVPTTFQPRTGTTPAPGAPIVLAAAGDAEGGELNAKLVADLMDTWNPNMVLYLGDVYEKGTPTEFDNWYAPDQYLGRFQDITNPVIGNHEYENGAAPGYFGYWGNPPSYYSVDSGDWHFIQLNSTSQFNQRDVNSPQYNWLLQDLQSSTSTCTIVSFHHPVFSVGPQGNTAEMMAIWGLLYDYGVDIVLTGHDHSYQRWEPLDGAGNPNSDGITSFVVGASGHGVQSFVRSDSRLAFGSDSPTISRGALRLTLNPGGAGFQYVNTLGQVLDSGSIPCHAGDDLVSPTDPTNLTVSSASGREVALDWDASIDNVGVAGYDIFRDGSLLTTSSGSISNFTDKTVAELTSYTYQVRAFDSAGNFSGLSNQVIVTTPELEPLFADDFESGALIQWSYVNGLTVQSSDVFGGAYSAQSTSTGSPAYGKWSLPLPEDELFYKLNFKVVSQGNNSVYLLKFRTAIGSSLVGLYVSSTGKLGYRNDVSGVSVTSSTNVTQGEWHEVQMRVHIGNPSSNTEVWFDGVKIVTLSNTESLGTAPIGEIQLGENSTGRAFNILLDDVLLNTESMQPSDTTPPQTTIDSAPASSTTATDADFTFSSSEPGSTFACALDGASFTSCFSPAQYSGLAAGAHTFAVRATDAVGNTDPTPANYNWTITVPDTQPPTVPQNLQAVASSETQVDLSWIAATDNVAVTGYTIYRDGTELATTSGITTTYSDTTVAAGLTYSYTIDAFDAANNHSLPSSPPTAVTTPSAGGNGTVTLEPVADGYVNAAQPAQNYGTSSRLRTDGSPDTRSYLKFNVPTVSGVITSVTLRVQAASNLTFGEGVIVSPVVDSSWTEGGLTYGNAPLVGSAYQTVGTPIVNGGWIEFDVTGLVSGSGLVSFALTSANNTALSLYSRQSGSSSSPTLVITTSNGNDTTPPETIIDSAPPSSATTTDADFTFSSSEPGSTFGALSTVRALRVASARRNTPACQQDRIPSRFRRPTLLVTPIQLLPNYSWTITVPDTQPPTVPQNLQAVASSETQVDLSWTAATDNVGVSGYTIYRDGIELATVGSFTLSYSDQSVVSSTLYSYTVDAFDATGNHSLPSNPPAVVTTPSAGGNGTVTLEPIADGYVNAAQPAQNYGASSRLRTDASPDIRSYLQFNIPSISGIITSVTLRVQAASNLDSGLGVTIGPVASNSWDEGSLTYANAPLVGSAYQTVGTPIANGQWIEFDVTGLVSGSGLMSFALTSANNTALSLYSRQSGSSSSPTLVITTSNGNDTTPPRRRSTARQHRRRRRQMLTSPSPPANQAAPLPVPSTVPALRVASARRNTPVWQSGAHSFAVRATDAVGNTDPTPANYNWTITVPDTQPPTVPQNLQAVASSGTQVDLSWIAATDNVAVTGYTIYRDGTELATTSGITTTYSDTTVTAGLTYSYTIDAFDAANNHSLPSSPPTAVTTPSAGGNGTVTLEPVADGYVNAAQPAQNYGTSSRLRTDGSPDTRSYLKFNVPTVSGVITSVTLRVQAASNLSFGEGVMVSPVVDSSWTEGGLTYGNAPLVGSAYQTVGTPIVNGGWIEFDVTGLVSGSGLVSFALTSANNTALSLYSRQSGSSSSPTLVITTQ